jgi:cell division transport system permease protein
VKIAYPLRETGANLSRNLTLTLASIVTVAVSLTLSGASLNLRQGVSNATVKWKAGVQFIVFMDPSATEEQVIAVGEALKANPEVDAAKLKRVGKEEAWAEVQLLFANSPETIDSFGGPAGTPESWRVVPKEVDADVIRSIGEQFRKYPGVYSVAFRSDAVERFQRFTRFLLLVFVSAAVALLASAALLIVNTIRLAMFARRREIEVMKLVGATNWFIRVPFMLEGLIQGLVGALIAWAASWGLNEALRNSLSKGVPDGGAQDFLQALAVSSGEVRSNGILLVVIGAGLGAIGSAIAVSRFLDV